MTVYVLRENQLPTNLVVAIHTMDTKITEAISEAINAGIPFGMVVGMLQAYLHAQTTAMLKN